MSTAQTDPASYHKGYNKAIDDVRAFLESVLGCKAEQLEIRNRDNVVATVDLSPLMELAGGVWRTKLHTMWAFEDERKAAQTKHCSGQGEQPPFAVAVNPKHIRHDGMGGIAYVDR